MRRYLSLFFLFLFCILCVCGQNDSVAPVKQYHVNRLTVSSIIAGGSVINYLSIKPLRNKTDISQTELDHLNRSLVNKFDRQALDQNPAHRKQFQQISDYSQVPFFLLPPAILAINKKMRKDWVNLMLIYWEGHTITFFSYNYSFLGPRFPGQISPVGLF